MDASRSCRGPKPERASTQPSQSLLVGLGQIEDDGLDALVNRWLPADSELEEDRVDHLLDRRLGEEERLRDRGVVLPLGHLAQDVVLPWRQLCERRLLWTRPLRDERLDDLGIDHRAAGSDRLNSAHELLEILDTL